MTDIDWSKAPEGTTHCMPSAQEWYKQTDQAYKWLSDGWALIANDLGEFRWSSDLIESPSPWTGDGLPPVGVEVKFSHKGQPQGVGRVLFYGAKRCIIQNTTKGQEREQAGVIADYSFSPIPTPEQIAEEERNAAIVEIGRLFHEGGPAAIYFAGYRKQEAV